jgi:hypothetical protein
MRFPIVFVSADEADEYIKNLIAYKTVYKKIAAGELRLGVGNYVDEDLNEEDIEDLLNFLARSDFNVKDLHTIIFLDDSANSRLLKPNSYICSLLS